MEDTELNMEELNALNPEEKANKLLEIAQQATAKAKQEADLRKQLESAQEKWVQKLLDDKKYQDLMRSEASKLKLDADYFVDLLWKDENLAKAVLDEYFGWMTIEAALAQVDGQKKQDIKTKKEKQEIDRTFEEMYTKKEVEKVSKEFMSKANLNAEEKTAFDKEFAELTEGKKLTEANIEKYLRLAFREAMPDVDVRRIERDALDMAFVPGNAKSDTDRNTHQARQSNISYLKKVGLL